MTITTVDQLVSAMGNNSSRLIIDKAQTINFGAGQFHSLWRSTGQPGQGAIPGATAVPNNATVGAIGFTQQTAPATSYLAILEGLCQNAGTTLEIHDRLAHMGGLVGNVTTAQTANVDLDALTTNNVVERRGAADYSDVTWWLEWYTDTGATVSNATVNVTFNDGTSGNLSAISLAATRRATFMQPLNGFIQAADSGKFIRDVNTVTLSASTGTAGSFGVTATRFRAALYKPLANARFTADWAGLGLPEIPNQASLFPVQVAASTSSAFVRVTGKIIHG
jgi:hypothetical protein